MKKFLSILTLLCLAVTGVWADEPKATIGTYTTRTISADYLTSTWAFDVVSGSAVNGSTEGQTDNEMVLVANSSNSNIKYQTSKYLTCKGTSSVYIPVPSGSAGTISLVMNSSSDTRYFQLYVNGTAGTEGQRLYSKLNADGITADGKKGPQSFSFTSSDITTYNNKTYLHFKDNNAEMKVTSFTVNLTTGTYAVGPSITTQPQGASYTTDQTMEALTVVATGSALTYQWYSCDDAAKTNAAAVSGATSASFTPTSAGFYFCRVTDSNNISVDSDVAEITVSAAEAPTISVSGTPASAVVVGTEVTLTATVTGVPAPTLQWYSNTTASTTGSTAIAGATSETYAPSTDAAGTYYYYAVATNSEGEATSAVQTIVVKEQVATPAFTPNGAYFENSQEVTLACTTDGATIKYSTDNGATWTDYTTALNFSETTTVQAKATKDDYIDSEVATATFNKVTLDAWTEVTGAATWDWSKFGTKEIKLTDTTTPKKTDEFVLSNAVNYGLCSAISSDFGNAQNLKVIGEYLVRDTKYFQGGYIKFHPTVAGTLSVTYSNTGNRGEDESLRRFLNVNGTNYGEGTMNGTAITTSDIYVPANNDVTIKGTLKGDGSDQYLRINKIEFTPLTETTVAVSDKLYRTFASKYPTTWGNISGLTAYKATVTGDNVTFEEVTGSVPAGEGLLLKATEAKTYTVPVSSTLPDAIENALVGVTKETTIEGAGIFVLYADDTHPIGFYKTEATSFTVGANTAYLPASTSARTFIALDEETTGIGATLMNSEKVNSEVYNLNGQRVMNPAKGLYIVNGKKVVIK